MLEITIKADSPELQDQILRFARKLSKQGQAQIKLIEPEGEAKPSKQARKYRKRGPLGFPPAWAKRAGDMIAAGLPFTFKSLEPKKAIQHIDKVAFINWLTKNHAYKAERKTGEPGRGWVFVPAKKGRRAC